MNTALWISQALLAAVFLTSGILKSTQSRQRMAETGQTGVDGLPLPLIRFIGVSEIVAAIGLILPAAGVHDRLEHAPSREPRTRYREARPARSRSRRAATEPLPRGGRDARPRVITAR
jgi:hypothetical protein